MTTTELHPALEPLAGIVGTWEGDGDGDYPTIEPFAYHEQVVFGHVGKPFLTYQQRTWRRDEGVPLHAEVGYLRLPRPDRPELVLAHPTGIVEVEEGTLTGGELILATTAVGLTSTAKQVRSLRRRFVLAGDTLTYDLWMAHADTPETHHLHARLGRTG